MRQFTYLMAFCFCFDFLGAQSQDIDEPLSKQAWSLFGPLSQHYTLGRKEKPDAAYAILKSYININVNILDLGCGTGISTRQLVKNGFKNVIGVDRDLLMIKEAQAANNKASPIKYIQADVAMGLPFADEQFDVITAISAFHWFSNPSSIKEVARVLKPNGYYFIIGGKSRYYQGTKFDPVKENIEKIFKEFGVVKPKKKNAAVGEILEEQGLKMIVDATIPYVNYYTKQEYLHCIQSQSIWNLVEEAQRVPLLKKIEQYLETVMDKKGLIKKEGSVTVTLAQKLKGD